MVKITIINWQTPSDSLIGRSQQEVLKFNRFGKVRPPSCGFSGILQALIWFIISSSYVKYVMRFWLSALILFVSKWTLPHPVLIKKCVIEFKDFKAFSLEKNIIGSVVSMPLIFVMSSLFIYYFNVLERVIHYAVTL